MSRRGLYELVCVGDAIYDVVKGSFSIGKQSLDLWVHTSSLTRPVLNHFQWFHDKEWEQAKKLSNSIKSKSAVNKYATHSTKRSIKKDQQVRQYSTKRDIESKEKEKNVGQNLDSSEVPSSRISRLFHYGQLAAGVGLSAASEGISQLSRGQSPQLKSLLLSDTNVDRITKKFSKMRGAALKLGQMMSFQDEKVLPEQLYTILSRVQNSAHYMPIRQLDRLLQRELGLDWEKKYSHFNKVPMAAASIGQVHEAVLLDGEKCVVKVQYPGVKDSIDSDLNNLLMLLTASRLLPKGLFLDKTVANARTELKWECDYLREAGAIKYFEELLKNDEVFEVPHVYEELTTENVITMQMMNGVEIMKLPDDTSQEIRDFICENIMRLCLQEIAQYKYMQTDPNWANFLYNNETKKIELLDFGASRPFPEPFIHNYRKLLTHATAKDYEGVVQASKDLGYLTGFESQAMIDAHVESVMTLGEPFAGSPSEAFDFSKQTVSDRVRSKIGVMLDERLCPPPEETYSLHRKFSGVFLLCSRMGAKVHCAKLFKEYFAL